MHAEMWYDEIPPGKSWASLWSGYVLCGHCTGIRQVQANCPACGAPPPSSEPVRVRREDGTEEMVIMALAGAEGRYEDYVYLQMLQREWERPAPDFEQLSHLRNGKRPSARAALALLFWSYFETRIERLLRNGMRRLPESVREDLLDRYSAIGARVYKLYAIVFGQTYFDDLRAFGFADVADLLLELHKRRNEFSHGQPQAIDDASVIALVGSLKAEHESWIAVFNRRATSASG